MESPAFGDRLRLRHINCFIAVAQERNIGRAAEQLRLTQPAISKTLSELEEILGVRLFERGRFGAKLTHDGELFLHHAMAVREALSAARRAVGAGAEPAPETLQIGALPTLAPDLLSVALQRFRAAHANARIVVHTAANTTLIEMLRGSTVDFVMGRMAEPREVIGLSFELLFVEPLVLAVRPGHPLAGREEASLSDALRFPLVVSTKGTVPRHHTESLLQAHGMRLPHACTETISVSLGRILVGQSDAIWFVPAGAVRSDLDAGALVRLAVGTEGTEEPVGLLYRSDVTASSLALEFMKVLREIAAGRRRVSS